MFRGGRFLFLEMRLNSAASCHGNSWYEYGRHGHSFTRRQCPGSLSFGHNLCAISQRFGSDPAAISRPNVREFAVLNGNFNENLSYPKRSHIFLSLQDSPGGDEAVSAILQTL